MLKNHVMRISKLAWSKNRKNELMNFYALEPDSKGKVVIYNPAFSWNSTQEALQQINIERATRQIPPHKGGILHLIFDLSSGALYLPDLQSKQEMRNDSSLPLMYDAVRMKIEKSIDYIPLAEPIRGDPFETLRIRKVGDFFSVADFIRRQVDTVAEFEKDMDLSVIEANLSIMPKTEKDLFGDTTDFSKKHSLFIKPGRVVDFEVSEMLDGKPRDVTIYQERGPFILINTSKKGNLSDSDKERIIVSAYRDYAKKNVVDSPMSKDSPLIQSYKYLMYIGWSFKELSILTIKDSTPNLPALLYSGTYIYNAAKLLKSEGYPDPTEKPYYYSFKIDQSFPFRFTNQNKILYDYKTQPEILRVIAFDPKTSYITIKTPLYLSSSVIVKVFNAKSDIITSEYDTTENVLKVNAPIDTLKPNAGTAFQALMMDVSNKTGTPAKSLVVQTKTELDHKYERKHISDYPQAAGIIRNLCEKISTRPDPEANSFPEKIVFDDLEVILGPWKKSSGFLGGYADVKTIKGISGGSPEFEPVPGLKIYAPVILIDNVQYRSVGDRTNILIHEYRHHINSQLWIDSPISDRPSETDSPEVRKQKMVKYLRSPDERIAHKAQFKYMLAIGMTREQVIKNIMGGKPTLADAPVLKEYLGIIQAAEKELSYERKELASEEKMKEEIRMKDEMDMTEGIDDFYDPSVPFRV
jgi:hypothetical protein